MAALQYWKLARTMSMAVAFVVVICSLAEPANARFGNCGVKCPTYPYSSPTCSWGKCGYTCNSGWRDCDYNKNNGCEANIHSDVNNCGNCGVKCMRYPHSSAKCSNGKCVAVCNQGWKDCNYNLNHGCETDVGNDIKNCGNCGVKCNSYPFSTPTCNGGKCGYTCNPGWKHCDYNNQQSGCETNVSNDVNNCGGCGEKCPSPAYVQATCSNGSCGVKCQDGYKYDQLQKKCSMYKHN